MSSSHTSELLEQVLKAHGGLDRWEQLSRVGASIVTGGQLWSIKGLVQVQSHHHPPRRLRAYFPAEIATHSAVQEFSFGSDNLLRRQDYRVDVAGGFAAVQYVDDIVDADGIRLPTRRRAYRADAAGGAIPDQLMVSIDVSDVEFN
jgi:hypothetical protein